MANFVDKRSGSIKTCSTVAGLIRQFGIFLFVFSSVALTKIDAAPRKANLCMSAVATLKKFQGFGHIDETANAIALIRGFRVSNLNRPVLENIRNKNQFLPFLSGGSILSRSLIDRLANRMRLIEKNYNGEANYKLDFISGSVIESAAGDSRMNELQRFLNDIPSHAEFLNDFHPGLNFGHYFLWFLAISGIVGAPDTFLNPANPNWSEQMMLLVPFYYVTNVGGLLNRVFGNGHRILLGLMRLQAAAKRAPKSLNDWKYFSYGMEIPKQIFEQFWITHGRYSEGIATQFMIEDLGKLRALVYVPPILRRSKVWMTVDLLLLPTADLKNWKLVVVIRSDLKKPKVLKTAEAKEPLAVGQLAPANGLR